MKPIALNEVIDFTEMTISTDGAVQQVLIRAGLSKNNRLYSDTVLQKAATLFEGRQTYADHPTEREDVERPERSIHGLTGWLTNVEFREGAVRATRHFTDNQAGRDARALVMAVVNKQAPPTLIGASINAMGTGAMNDDGIMVIESLDHIFSVDDVTAPAAGGGWAESAGKRDMIGAVLKALSFEDWRECRPDYLDRLTRELKTARQTRAVSEAQALAASLSSDLDRAKAEIASLTEALQSERDINTRSRAEHQIDGLLMKADLPEAWRADLKQQLLATETDAWASIIEREARKAKAARKSRVAVQNSPQAVQRETPVRLATDPVEVVRAALGTVRNVDDFERLLSGDRT